MVSVQIPSACPLGTRRLHRHQQKDVSANDLAAGDGDILAVEDSEQRCQEEERKEAQPDPVESVWLSSRASESGSRSRPIWTKPPAQKENATRDERHPQTVPALSHHQHDAVLLLLDRITFSAT